MSFRILCISGGGYLGLYAAALLAKWEEQLGVPLASRFDLIAGTSIGGVLALAIAAEIPVSEVKTTFESQGETIFPNRGGTNRLLQRLKVLRSLFRPRYSSEPLRRVLRGVYEDRTMGDLARRVIVPAVNLNSGKPQLFKTPHHIDFHLDQSLSVVDVAMATSAAPTYFPAAKVGEGLFADGGLFANTPDLLALHEANYFLEVANKDIEMISVGTTSHVVGLSGAHTGNFGVVDWLTDERLISALMSSQERSAEFIAQHRLGDRYLRINAMQSEDVRRQLGLDIASSDAQRALNSFAEQSHREFSNHILLRSVFEHPAQNPTFPARI